MSRGAMLALSTYTSCCDREDDATLEIHEVEGKASGMSPFSDGTIGIEILGMQAPPAAAAANAAAPAANGAAAQPPTSGESWKVDGAVLYDSQGGETGGRGYSMVREVIFRRDLSENVGKCCKFLQIM